MIVINIQGTPFFWKIPEGVLFSQFQLGGYLPTYHLAPIVYSYPICFPICISLLKIILITVKVGFGMSYLICHKVQYMRLSMAWREAV